MAVACQCELGLQARLVELLPDLELKRVARQKAGWGQPVQCGGGGYDHHVRPAVPVFLLDAPERGQALADQVLVRRKGVVRQGFPVGEQRAAQARGKKRDLVQQPLGGAGVGSDDGSQFACSFFTQAQRGNQQGVRRAHGLGQGVAFAGGEFG